MHIRVEEACRHHSQTHNTLGKASNTKHHKFMAPNIHRAPKFQLTHTTQIMVITTTATVHHQNMMPTRLDYLPGVPLSITTTVMVCMGRTSLMLQAATAMHCCSIVIVCTVSGLTSRMLACITVHRWSTQSTRTMLVRVVC